MTKVEYEATTMMWRGPSTMRAPGSLRAAGILAAALASLVSVSSALAEPEPEPEPEPDAVGVAVAEDPKPSRVQAVVLPSIGYNTDDGFGFGAFLNLRKNVKPIEAASSDDESTGIGEASSNDHRRWIWAIQTGGMMFIDPEPSGWRFFAKMSWLPGARGRTEFVFLLGSDGYRWDQWYGLGNDTRRDVTGTDEPVSSYEHRFGFYQLRGAAQVRGKVSGPLSLYSGFLFNADWIEIYPDTFAQKADEDGEVIGAEGGGTVGVEGGVLIDTRDVRHDPTSGGMFVAGAQARFGDVGVSGWFTFDLRGFAGPPGKQIVLAGQILGQAQLGAVPFYAYGQFAGLDSVPRMITGLGGLRGLDRGRIRAPLSLLVRGEFRIRPPAFHISTVSIRLEPLVFGDAARGDRLVSELPAPPIHLGLGGGLRVIINEQAVLRIDLGVSPDYQSDQSGESTVWTPEFYVAMNHTF